MISLRKLQPSDADRIEELASVLPVAQHTLNIPHPYPKGGGRDFVEMITTQMAEGKCATFAVVENASEQLVGCIGLRIESEHNRAELGYWIGQDYWGRGYCTEAARLILAHGFNDLALRRIMATALTQNGASSRVMEKIGMKHEGILRQHVTRFGVTSDMTVYGILRDEFKRK